MKAYPLKNVLTSLFLLAVVLLALPTTTHSQQANPDLHQALLDLNNAWTVMCVAAHPDDEDGTTLTVLRRKHGVHTVSLFSTFGEGGQNAVGPELYEELGGIRADETMKASEIQGSEPHFLGLKDFGFSKSSEETFRLWGHDEALRRMVLKLRELRPDVVITNHDTSRGHGHHQATGQLILEAFDAAADAKQFPEQLDRVKPWQVQRLFVRIFGPATTKVAATAKIVAIDPNEMDPVRDSSFAEQALTALQQHATQGPWPKSVEDLIRSRGVDGKLPLIRYQLVREAPNAGAMPSQPATFFDGLKAPAAAQQLDEEEAAALINSSGEADRALTALINLQATASDRISTTEANNTRRPLFNARLNAALATAAGVTISVKPSEPVVIPGEKSTFVVTLTNAGKRPLQVRKVSFSGWGKVIPLDVPDHLLADTDTTAAIEVTSPSSATHTVPKAAHLYDGTFPGAPFSAEAEIDIEGAVFVVTTRERIPVVPPVEIEAVSPSPCVRTEETLGRCDKFDVKFTNHLSTPFRGTITINVAPSGRVAKQQLVLAANESRIDAVRTNNTVPPIALAELRKSGSATIGITPAGSTAAVTTANVPIVYGNARATADLRVAYIPSFDETLKNALGALGVEAVTLDASQIKDADLSKYDTIIVDNRGYEAHPELVGANSKLLEFVNAGGTMIVFYHKTNEWNPDPKKNRPQLAPYPIVLGDERVTDENAVVTFLMPLHPLLNFPNRIRRTDFSDWIQERGLYYPKEWDQRYAALFAMSDKGEKPLRGGLLVGRHGKGQYIYTSMVWYRQLRAGVPGAYRMFANMISYGSARRRSP